MPWSARNCAQEAQVRASLTDLQPQTTAQTKDLQTRIGMLAAQIRQIDSQLALQRKQDVTAGNFVEKAAHIWSS